MSRFLTNDPQYVRPQPRRWPSGTRTALVRHLRFSSTMEGLARFSAAQCHGRAPWPGAWSLVLYVSANLFHMCARTLGSADGACQGAALPHAPIAILPPRSDECSVTANLVGEGQVCTVQRQRYRTSGLALAAATVKSPWVQVRIQSAVTGRSG
jgi:hypothetical protein